jgi:hypothetical protein
MLFYATKNSRLRQLFRRSTWLGISCRYGPTPSIAASAFRVSRWQSSFFQSLSSFSSSSQNSDTDRAQNLFLMAHNPDSVIYLAPSYHQLTMQSGEISKGGASFRAEVGQQYWFRLNYEHVVSATSLKEPSVSLTMRPNGPNEDDIRAVMSGVN